MFLRNFLKDYLTFSKKDRWGSLVLLALLLFIYLIPHFFSRNSKGLTIKESQWLVHAVDSLRLKNDSNGSEAAEENPAPYQFQQNENTGALHGELFPFDPNTLSAEGWQKLGLSRKTSKTIEKYRNKGGRFYQPEDLQKIWGLPAGFYEKVKDYIRIESGQTYSDKVTVKSVETAIEKPAMVDINEADTSILDRLPGIGNKLASRIVNFREKLGGFYAVEQIAEIYGLPDSTFQKIRERLVIGTTPVRKLNINTATRDELKVHPYLKWSLANSIVEYRSQHGNYKSLDELKKINIIDESTFQKISPYLSL